MSTKKDFIRAAQTVALIENAKARRAQAETLANEFAAQNPRFNRARFLATCNVKEGAK